DALPTEPTIGTEPTSAAEREELEPKLEEPGFLDILAEMEIAMPRMTGILEEMTGVVGQVTTLATRGTEEIQAADASGGPVVAKRMAIIQRFATDLDKSAHETEEIVGRYREEMSKVNKG